MFAFLLSVGILVTLAGGAAIGFGIPNNGFDLGNTLLIAGTTASGAGLVLIGLAACVRELRRISDGLPARIGARPARPLDASAEPQAAASPRAAPSARSPYPEVPAEAQPREPWPLEPRMPAHAPAPMEERSAERARGNVFPIARPDHPLVDEPEAVPLAPSRGPAAPLGRTPAPPGEPPYEPKFGPADILARLSGQGRAAAKGEAARPLPVSERPPPERPATEPPPAPPPANERPRGPLFDTVWPSAGKPPGRAGGPDTIPRVSRPEPAPEPQPEPRERYEPPMGGEPREMAPPRPPVETRAVSILKSGVIDGMAYTLYTDGSIEAQLPQGTMRFASIDDLRAHLESQG